MNTSMTNRHVYRAVIPAIVILVIAAAAAAAALAQGTDMAMKGSGAMATMGYRYELAGPVQTSAGKSTVSVRLVHEGRPVSGAIIIQSRADMGPMGMAAMTAPIRPLGEKPPGTYRFEVSNGPVWNKPDNWALSFSAKVQGVAQTVSGSVTVKLAP